MIKKILSSVLVLTIAVTAGVFASSPFQVSITPDIALYNRNERIKGLSIGLWGENPQKALALGVVQGSTGQSSGLSIAFLNYADSYKGIHWGTVNYTKNDFLGWQNSAVNYTEGTMKGLQSGTINYANRLRGLQWGFINYAASVEAGVQIGMINIMPQSKFLTELPKELSPLMIAVNWKF
ncbi:MAG: hypothetical protein ACQEQC_06535 [Elusimicrobiota bacterium]